MAKAEVHRAGGHPDTVEMPKQRLRFREPSELAALKAPLERLRDFMKVRVLANHIH